MISNDLLNDKNLSLKAKGIYSFMFSKPDGFNFTIRSMSKLLLEGQRSIMGALQELKDMGWVNYSKNNDGSGVYFLNDEPNLQNSNLGEPNLQNPNLRNRNLLKEQRINNTDNTNNKDYNKKDEIDFSKLVLYFNKCFNKSSRVCSTKAKDCFKARMKEGYKKEDIVKVIDNCVNDNFHRDLNYKNVSLEFLSRPVIFERYAAMEHKKPITQIKDAFTNQ